MSSLLITLLSTSYFYIFILMIFEGPIVTLLASALAVKGHFNPFIILLLAVLGDIVADLFLFFTGRIGKTKFLKYHNKKHHIGKRQLDKIKQTLYEHPFKAIITVKTIPPLAIPGLMLAGSTHMKIHKFLFHAITTSTINKSIYTAIGYFAGLSVVYTLQRTDAIYGIPLVILIVLGIGVGVYNIHKIVRNKLREKEKL